MPNSKGLSLQSSPVNNGKNFDLITKLNMRTRGDAMYIYYMKQPIKWTSTLAVENAITQSSLADILDKSITD